MFLCFLAYGVFQVESDLDFVTGGENITVLPGKTGRYEMCVKPLRRGHYKGVLSFVAAPNPVKYVCLTCYTTHFHFEPFNALNQEQKAFWYEEDI